MTQQELDALKERLTIARQEFDRPLEVAEERNEGGNFTIRAGGVLWIADAYSRELAEFFAAAPADIDALVAEVERLMQAGRDMQQQRDEWREEAERLRVEVGDLRTMLAAADPDVVWVD